MMEMEETSEETNSNQPSSTDPGESSNRPDDQHVSDARATMSPSSSSPDADHVDASDETLRFSPKPTSRQGDKEIDDDDDTRVSLSDGNGNIKLISETRLMCDGHLYARHEKLVEKIRWICIKYRNQQCRSRLVTTHPSPEDDSLIVLRDDDSHNHPPSSDAEIEKFATVSKKETRASNASNAVSSDTLPKERQGYLDHPVLYRKFLLKFSEKPEFKRKYIMRALKVIYTSLGGCIAAFGRILEHRKKVTRDLELLKNDPNAIISGLKCKSRSEITSKLHKTRARSLETEVMTETNAHSETESSSKIKPQHTTEEEKGESNQCEIGSKKVARKSGDGRSNVGSRDDTKINLTKTQSPEKKTEVSARHIIVPSPKNKTNAELNNLENLKEGGLNDPIVCQALAQAISANSTALDSSADSQQVIRFIKVGDKYHIVNVDSCKETDGTDKIDKNARTENGKISKEAVNHSNHSTTTSSSKPHQTTQEQNNKRNYNSHDGKHHTATNSSDKTAASRENQPNSINRARDEFNKMDEYVPMKIQNRSRDESTRGKNDPKERNYNRQDQGHVQNGQDYKGVPWSREVERRNQHYLHKNQNNFEPRRFDRSRDDFKRQAHPYPYERSNNNRGYRPHTFNAYNKPYNNYEENSRSRNFSRENNGRSYSRWDRKPDDFPHGAKASSNDSVSCSDRAPAHNNGNYNQAPSFVGNRGFDRIQDNPYNSFRGGSRCNPDVFNRGSNYRSNDSKFSENETQEKAFLQKNNARDDQAWVPLAQRPMHDGQLQENNNYNGSRQIPNCVPQQIRYQQQQQTLVQDFGNLNESKGSFGISASSIRMTDSMDGERMASFESGYASESQNLQNISNNSLPNNTSREILFPGLTDNADELNVTFNDFDIPTLHGLETPLQGVDQNMASFQHSDCNLQQPRIISSRQFAASSPHTSSGDITSSGNIDYPPFRGAQPYYTQEFDGQYHGYSKPLSHDTQNLVSSLSNNPQDREEVVVLRNRVEKLENELLNILRQDLRLAQAELSAAEAKSSQTFGSNVTPQNPPEMSQRSTFSNQPGAVARATSTSTTARFVIASTLAPNAANDQVISTVRSEDLSGTTRSSGTVSNQQQNK